MLTGFRGHCSHFRPLYTRWFGEVTHMCPREHSQYRGVLSDVRTSSGPTSFLVDHSCAMFSCLDFKLFFIATQKVYHELYSVSLGQMSCMEFAVLTILLHT